MPVYCFKRPDGLIVEEFFHTAEDRPERIACWDGVIAERSIAAEHSSRHAFEGGRTSWPLRSVAAGVHPNQMEKAVKDSNGLLKFVKNPKDPQCGDAIFESPQHRRDCLTYLGMVDLDGNEGGHSHNVSPWELTAEK